jgi:non-heme chloroperoxidase
MTRIDALNLDHLPEHFTPKVYPSAPHGLCSTLKDQVNDDLLAFFKP